MKPVNLSERSHLHSLLIPANFHTGETGAGLLRIFCLFTLLCGSVGRGMAQEKAVPGNDSRWSAELKFGAAIPTGSFASADPSKANAGWAETGPALGLALNYRMTRNFGVNFSLSGQQNLRNNGPLISSIKASQPYAAQSEVRADAGTWTIGRVLAGGYLLIPLSNSGKWMLRPAISAGLLKTGIPRSDYTAVFQSFSGPLSPLGGTISESGTYKVPSFPWSFCYSADAGLVYNFAHKFYVTGDVGYFYSAPRSIYNNPQSPGDMIGTGTVIIPPPSGPPIVIANPSLPKHSFPISSLNIMVGVGVRF